MPATLDVRTRRKAFKGGPDLWNAVVSGPLEVFERSRALPGFLVRHGFSRLPTEDGREVWTLPAAAVAPPLYLGPLLGARFGIRMSRSTEAMVRDAITAQGRQGSLAGILGGDLPRGSSMDLVVRAGSRGFIAACDAADQARLAFLAGSGWLPADLARLTDRVRAQFGDRPHVCSDPFLAGNLTPFMDERAKALLGEMAQVAKRNIALSGAHDEPENFDIPEPEGLSYLPFQRTGIATVLAQPKSAIIADDMGLGKTIQGVGILNGSPDARRILVICQANMKLKWVRELRKWMVNQDLSIAHAEGDNFPDTDIAVINYDIVARHHGNVHARPWDLVLVDEGHNLKNHESGRTQAVLGDVIGIDPARPAVPLARGGRLVFLTGTPKPNSVSDLWPLLTSTRPDIWGRGPEAYKAFMDRYEPPKLIRKTMRRGSREFEVTIPLRGEPVRELELQLRMRGSGGFIRRMKRDTDLPPKFRTPLELPFRFTDEDRKALAQIDADIETLAMRVAVEHGRIKVGERLPAGAIIDVITGLAPSSPHFTEGARVRANLGALKAPYMARFITEELLQDEELSPDQRRKTVVFAHHKTVIATMAQIIRETFPNGVLVYDGSISSPKKKQELVDRFQTDPDARVFLMSRAGNSGITLTAACRMRNAEPDWDPGNMAQIEDRIWRIGQMQPCDIGYLYAPGSYDMNIGEGLIRKMDADERILNSFVLTKEARQKRHIPVDSGTTATSDALQEMLEADQDDHNHRVRAFP